MRSALVCALALLLSSCVLLSGSSTGTSLAERCAGLKKDCDGCNLILENEGFPLTRNCSVCTTYRNCMEGR